jgi:predicted nucleotidyltransferase component of viral defense system
MNDDNVSDFGLAGGTALALQLGHRISVDLDFFSYKSFNTNDLYAELKYNGFTFNENTLELEKNTLNGHINNIKVQFLSHIYKPVSPLKTEEEIRLYDLPDIAAMKLNAISNRGAKKDFWDYTELLKIYSLSAMLGFYEKKYDLKNIQHVLKSLTYFDDAELEKDPVCLNGQSWKDVKKSTLTSVKNFVNSNLK